jgi:hypothetical protein
VEDEADEDDEWGDPFDGDDDEDWDEQDDDMRAFFDRMFGGGSARGRASSEVRAESARKAANDARLKTCYRQLAKRLHPDHSALEETIREKRWHEIQEAYHNNDLEGLLRVEAICDMDEEGLSIKLGLARLRDLAAYHKSHLIPIRNSLRAAKQDIAFGFSKKGLTPKVERQIAGDLKYESIGLKAAVSDLAREAKEIRNEVEAHIRESEVKAARAARHAERVKERQPKPRHGAKKKATSTKKAEVDTEQMTFF